MDAQSQAQLNRIEQKLDKLIGLMENNKTYSSPNKQKKPKQKAEKSGNAIVTIYNDVTIITGNTYSNKNHLKSVGCHWSPANKGWQVKSEQIKKLREKIASVFETASFKEVDKNLLEPEIEIEDTNFENEQCNIDSDDD